MHLRFIKQDFKENRELHSHSNLISHSFAESHVSNVKAGKNVSEKENDEVVDNFRHRKRIQGSSDAKKALHSPDGKASSV